MKPINLMNQFYQMNILFSSMMLATLITMFVFRKQMLLILITLELTNLAMFMSLLFKMVTMMQPVSISFYMIIMSACEASMALSILIKLTRIKGSDMLSSISKFKF